MMAAHADNYKLDSLSHSRWMNLRNGSLIVLFVLPLCAPEMYNICFNPAVFLLWQEPKPHTHFALGALASVNMCSGIFVCF